MESTDASPTDQPSGAPGGTACGSPLAQRIALDYVTRWKWPVLVGVPDRGKVARATGVDEASADGDYESAVLEPTTDPGRVRAWWERWPDAGIVAPAGGGFEAVTLPMRAGQAVLDQLTEHGAWLGPVMSDDDTVTLLIRPGQGALWMALVTGRDDGSAHAGHGQFVTLPPGSPRARHNIAWVVPPTPANVPHLPRFEDLAPLVSSAAPRQRKRRFW